MASLGTVGIADKGKYSADATYAKGNFVYHNGSSWLALKDNLTGVTPEEGENWKYLARGYAAELLSMITALDTSGVLGEAGASVSAQSLIDTIADQVMTKLLAKTAIVQAESTATDKIPSSAYFKQVIDAQNRNLQINVDNIEHRESVYSLFKNNLSDSGPFKKAKNTVYHFRIGGDADPTFGNGHFVGYIMADGENSVFTALIVSKWTGDAWSMIFTNYDQTNFIKKLS